MVLECPATKPFGTCPKFAVVPFLPTFTQCIGVPARSSPWVPLQWPQPPVPVSATQWSHIFTDGSASPPEFPGIRLSSWSVIACHETGVQYFDIISGLTPGYVHNIARAETYAILQALRQANKCVLYVDNQSVVNNLGKICLSGFNPLVWRGHPNFDLWLKIANIVVSRGPEAIHVIKVKSHQEPSAAATSHLAWIIRGNDRADRLAKQFLWNFVHNKPDLQNRAPVYENFIKHSATCSHMLQEISQLVFQVRKDKEKDADERDRRQQLDVLPEEEDLHYLPRDIAFANIPSCSTWDPKWLDLVAHYFALLKWPSPEPTNPHPISMLELMLDRFIAFQLQPPVNMRLFLRRQTIPAGVDVSQHHTQYVLFPRHEASLFPPTMLTDASYIWLRTFDLLQPLLNLTPYPRSSLYALGNYGICNSSPSMPVRPQLLCGQLVSHLLASTLVPGVRVLKYRLVITPAEPRPLPSSFPPNF